MRNKFISLIILVLTLFCGCEEKEVIEQINVLILSGSNNHEWKKTTPVLVKMYKDAGLFNIDVTESPDTLKYENYKKYDVVVSNWNTWPDNDKRWDSEKEKALLKYVSGGGGMVFIHAGASSFYQWDEYHKIGIGRWGKETSHGKQAKGKVNGFDPSHPVTKGLSHFYIFDEIWEKADIHPSATPIAKVSSRNEISGYPFKENAVFVNNIGKGRSFYTILGHNQSALFNTGLRTLLTRGTEWAARGVVTTGVPIDLQLMEKEISHNYAWGQSDSTFSLKNDNGVVWQYNFNNRYKKPYFHPVVAHGTTLTCVSPLDHPWHLGLWFSWKYINKVNYWEYLNEYKSEGTGYKSRGITDIKSIDFIKKDDFSASISMEIDYYPDGGETVMMEKRRIDISSPESDGSYYFDYEHVFTASADEVEIDRTPLPGEPRGKPHGGYAGLSIRYSQDFSSAFFISSNEIENYHGVKSDWLYMEMRTLLGEKAGICFYQYTKETPESAGWFIVDNQETPFHYFSPSPIFKNKIVLKKDEKLVLKYRAWVLNGEVTKKDMEKRISLIENEGKKIENGELKIENEGKGIENGEGKVEKVIEKYKVPGDEGKELKIEKPEKGKTKKL